MNESKVQDYRNFKESLRAAAAALGAQAIPTPREGPTAWRVTAPDNANVFIELTFVQEPRGISAGPSLAIGPGSRQQPLTNLSVANIKKHLIKHLTARRQHLSELALQDAQDAASTAAETSMAKTIHAAMPGVWKHTDPAKSNKETAHVWRSERGHFRLAYVHVTGTVNAFEFEYNVEYDLFTGPNREIRVHGEFDAKTSEQINRTISALMSIN